MFPKRCYTKPFSNEIDAGAVSARVDYLTAYRSRFAQAPVSRKVREVAAAEVNEMAGREQAEFAKHTRAEFVDRADGFLAQHQLTTYDDDLRDRLIRSLIFDSPAVITTHWHHNQIAHRAVIEICAGRDFSDPRAHLALPALVAANAKGRAALAKLQAEVFPLLQAAE